MISSQQHMHRSWLDWGISIPRPNLRNICCFFAALLITAFPHAKLALGPLPLYFIDVLTFFVICRYGLAARTQPVVRVLIFLYLVLGVAVGIREMFHYMVFPEVVYMIGRYGLSFLIALTLPALVEKGGTLKAMLSGLVAGLFINAVVGILFSFPFTGDFVEEKLFTIGVLYPGRKFLDWNLGADRILAMRAETFVGGSNIVGLFVLIGIAFSFALYKRLTGKLSRTFIVVLIFLGLLCCFLTYSRSTYMAAGMLLFVLLLQRSNKMVRKYFLAGLLAVVSFVLYKGIDNELFDFDRITATFAMLSGEQELGYSEQARILAYTKPITWIAEDPHFLLIGNGYSQNKLVRRDNVEKSDKLTNLESGENHFYFAALLLERGLPAALIMTILYFYSLFMVFFAGYLAPTREARQYLEFRASLQLAFTAMLPFMMFTHITANSLHGSYILFLLFGLLLIMFKWRRSLLQTQTEPVPAS